MNAATARDLTKQFFGEPAATNFDPLWPETLLGLGEFEQTPAILTALHDRLVVLEALPLSVERARYEQLLKSVASQMIDGPGATWAGRHDGLLAAFRAAHASEKPPSLPSPPALPDDAPISLAMEAADNTTARPFQPSPQPASNTPPQSTNHYQSMRQALRRDGPARPVPAPARPGPHAESAANEQIERYTLMAENLLAREGASGATLGKIESIGQQLGLDAAVAQQVVQRVLSGGGQTETPRGTRQPAPQASPARSAHRRSVTASAPATNRSSLGSTFDSEPSPRKWSHLLGAVAAVGVLVLGLAGIGWLLVSQISSKPAAPKIAAGNTPGASGTTTPSTSATPLIAGVPAGADGGRDIDLAVPTSSPAIQASRSDDDATRFKAGSATDARSILTALSRLNQQLGATDAPDPAALDESRLTGQQAMTMLLEGWPTLDAQLRTALAEGLVQHALVMRRFPQNPSVEQIAQRLDEQTQRVTRGPLDAIDLTRTIGTGGVAVRLLREPEIPESVRKAASGFILRAKIVPPQAATYGDGLIAAVPAAWERVYVDLANPASTLTPAACAERCRDFVALARRAAGAASSRTGSKQDAGRVLQQQLIDAAESLLSLPADQADGSTSPAWESRRLSIQRSALEALSAALLFRPGDPARQSLLAWLASERISSVSLHVLTSMLASTSTSAGFDATTVLPPSAAMPDREALRSQLAERWQTPLNVSGADDATRWGLSVQRLGVLMGEAKSDVERLQVAAYGAELHLAAWQLHQRLSGRSTGGAADAALWLFPLPEAMSFDPKLLSGPSFTLPSGTQVLPGQGQSAIGPGDGGGMNTADGQWALRYLTDSRTTGLKVAALNDFRQRGPLGPIDAEVLVEAALTTSGEVRIAAQDAAIAHRDNPLLLQAALDIVPRVPRSMRVQRFLAVMTESIAESQPLTSTDPAWLAFWRKALIEKLVERAALTSSIGSADVLASRMASSYGTMLGYAAPQTLTSAERAALGVDAGLRSAGGGPAGVPQVAEGELASPALLASAASMRAELVATQTRQALAGMTRKPIIALNVLEQRAASRQASAIGGPQAFVASQLTLAEALGVLVASERPGQEARVEQILTALDEALTKASAVTDQIARCEIAINQLWAIRLGVGL